MALYGSNVYINTDGATAWTRIDAASVNGTEFVSGDWIISSVATAHSGWTNVSATYSNKFIRINATPLATGGSDTHTHGGTTGSHTLTTAEMPSHRHIGTSLGGSGSEVSYSVVSSRSTTPDVATTSAANQLVGDGGGHTHTVASADNVPGYVQCAIFQKD